MEKITIDELEKILNSERADDLDINIRPDGSIVVAGEKTEAMRAEEKRAAEIYKNNLIKRLSEENAALKAALKALTDRF